MRRYPLQLWFAGKSTILVGKFTIFFLYKMRHLIYFNGNTIHRKILNICVQSIHIYKREAIPMFDTGSLGSPGSRFPLRVAHANSGWFQNQQPDITRLTCENNHINLTTSVTKIVSSNFVVLVLWLCTMLLVPRCPTMCWTHPLSDSVSTLASRGSSFGLVATCRTSIGGVHECVLVSPMCFSQILINYHKSPTF